MFSLTLEKTWPIFLNSLPLNRETWDFGVYAYKIFIHYIKPVDCKKASEERTCPFIYLLDFIFLPQSIMC